MPSTSKLVRFLPYPVIEEGNGSFKEGEYNVEIESQEDASITLKHSIQHAPLIKNLISKKKARYACLIAIPSSGYRKLHIHKNDNSTQRIEWEIDFVSEPPIFKPVILCTKEHRCTLSAKDGVAPEWQGVSIKIPKGARLALKRFFRQSGNITGLLQLEMNKDFSDGSFEVSPCTENGFYFKIEAAENLCDFLKKSFKDTSFHRKSIITHIISRCFEILKSDYQQDEEWDQFSNLKALAEHLRGKDLPVWNEDDFVSDKVATRYEPHCPPSLSVLED